MQTNETVPTKKSSTLRCSHGWREPINIFSLTESQSKLELQWQFFCNTFKSHTANCFFGFKLLRSRQGTCSLLQRQFSTEQIFSASQMEARTQIVGQKKLMCLPIEKNMQVCSMRLTMHFFWSEVSACTAIHPFWLFLLSHVFQMKLALLVRLLLLVAKRSYWSVSNSGHRGLAIVRFVS